MVEEKVPKIDCPWIQDGKIKFVPTGVKWVESIVQEKDKQQKVKNTN